MILLLLLAAQDVDAVRAAFTKYEHEIPMRDGRKLFTAVYVPKDPAGSYPILLTRTPYGCAPYGVDAYRPRLAYSEKMEKDGYIFVFQDVRGRHMSEGEFVHVRPRGEVDESTDTWDTIDWLVKNVPRNAGKVGLWGISYPGFYAAAGMIDAHPALLAVSPQAPVSNWFGGDDWHHNGAFYVAHAFGWFSTAGRTQKNPTLPLSPAPKLFTDAYAFYLAKGTLAELSLTALKGEIPFWNELMAHGAYDEFWKARDLRPRLTKIKPAVMTVGGWFDAENLYGALEVYGAVERQNPGISNVLVMGPWYHGGWATSDGSFLGHVRFGTKTAVHYRDEIEAAFFARVLKGAGKDLPEATVFQTGTNEWRTFSAWPPKTEAKTIYLREGGRLSFEPPADAEGVDDYVSDPAKPVPFTAGTAGGMTREHMVDDQRFAATRPDVLVYQSEPLERDVTVAGPLRPRIHVSTSGTDADWVVKVIDVYPDTYPDPDPNPTGVKMAGYQQLLRGECMRGKFRKSLAAPEPFEPGKAEVVEYGMPDVLHTFRKGHRIMVQIQSSWFPLVDRNPQTFTDIYSAKASDFRKATQRVYRSKALPSGVELGLLPP